MLKTANILVLALFCAAAVYGQPSISKKRGRQDILKAAKDHIRFEEFNEAIPYVEQLLEEEPNSAYYNFWMGKCLYVIYKKKQALPFFEVVDRVDPEVDKEFHYYYGLTLHYNLKFGKAIAAYRKDLERYDAGSEDYRWVSNRIAQCEYANQLVRRREGDQVKIRNMGEQVNTPYAEHSPVISANDSVMIFTARRPDCLGAKPDEHYYDEDLYISRKENGGWSEAENIGKPVNSTGHDATISLTADGQTIYIYRHKKGGGLYKTDFDPAGKKWREPKAVDKPLNSKYYETSICMSADSSKMFFTSDRPGGFGGKDIYLIRREGKKWSDPENLGPRINTAFDEDAPYFHPDGKTLYYSSNGASSMGGYDIFVTELDSATTGGWLQPLNTGYPVNTSDDDIYFVLSASGKYGYYSSGKEDGYGEKDIYQIEFPYYPYPRRYFIIEMTGTVQDVQSMDTLPAKVVLIDNNTGEEVDSVYTDQSSRNFYFILEPDASYTIEVSSGEYNAHREEFSTPSLKDEDVLMDKNVLLAKKPKPVVIPDPVVRPKAYPEIQHIYFDFDRDALRQESRNELDMIASMLQENSDMSLRIMGHTDWYGTYTYNVALSQERAKTAYKYLQGKGIGAERLSMDHFSENQPLASNDDDNGRQYNRRNEFQFIKEGKTLFTSVKLRKGSEGVRVDRTRPKGQPGFDNPTGEEHAALTPVPEDEDGRISKDESIANLIGDSDPVEETTGTTAPAIPAPTPEAEKILAGFSLHHVYFDFDRAGLRPISKSELDKVVTLLKQNPQLKLQVYGHTDNFGSVTYNQALSDRRSKSAYQYILYQGITPDQVEMTGFSELKPLDTNDNETGRQLNRRVEFNLLLNNQQIYQSIP